MAGVTGGLGRGLDALLGGAKSSADDQDHRYPLMLVR